jgi:hypothetical protein
MIPKNTEMIGMHEHSIVSRVYCWAQLMASTADLVANVLDSGATRVLLLRTRLTRR